MRLLLAILLTLPLSALAQFGAGVASGGWEPLNIVTKAAIVACYDAGNASTITLNGTGVQQLRSRVVGVTNHLNQATAGNRPIISRRDNKGNLATYSESFENWTRVRVNAFGATDTGAAGAGSFANTSRTTDPSGGNAADFIQEDGTATSTHILISQTVPEFPDGGTFSVWLKAATNTSVLLYFNGINKGRGFELSNGTTVAVSGNPNTSSYSIASVGDGWFYCSISNSFSGIIDARVYMLTNSAGTYTTSYSGDNTKGIFIYGASIIPSAWSTNYIATTTTIVVPGINNRTTLYCDGAAHYLKAAAFTLNQPTESYRICMPWTWTLNDAAFDGNSSGSGKLYQSATTPNIRMNAGTDATEFVPPAAGTWRVTSTVFDGANSRMSTNNGAWVTSDAGTNNMGGFTLSANGANTAFWNGQVAYQILCSKTNGTPEANFLRTCLMRRAGL